jgi:hypothetical protein
MTLKIPKRTYIIFKIRRKFKSKLWSQFVKLLSVKDVTKLV